MIILFLVLTNIAVYLWTILNGVHWLNPAPIDLYFLGGSLSPLSLTTEKYKLLTSFFLHSGLVHLIFNTLFLVQIGPLALKILSKRLFILTYLVCGLSGSIISALWNSYHMQTLNFFGQYQLNIIVSVGASGALLGITAATFIIGYIKQRQIKNNSQLNKDNENFDIEIFEQIKKLGPVLMMNLLIGFFIDGIDNSAHFGGTIGGILISILYYLLQKKELQNRIEYYLTFTAILLLLVNKIPLPIETNEITDQIKLEITEIKNQKTKMVENKAIAAFDEIETKQLPAPTDTNQIQQILIDTKIETGEQILNEAEDKLYIPSYAENKIIVLNLLDQTTKEIKLSIPKDCPHTKCKTHKGISAIAISKNEDWGLAVYDSLALIVLFDTKTGESISSFTSEEFPRLIILTKDNKKAFIFNSRDNSITVIDPMNKLKLKTIKLSEQKAESFSYYRPFAMKLNSTSTKLYVTNDPKNQIEIIDANSLEIENSIGLKNEENGLYDLFLNKSEDYLWALSSHALLKVDLKTKAITKSLKFCRHMSNLYTGLLTDNDNYFIFNLREEQKLVAVSLNSYKSRRVFPIVGYPNSLIKLKNEKEFLVDSFDNRSIISKFNWDKFTVEDKSSDYFEEILCQINENNL